MTDGAIVPLRGKEETSEEVRYDVAAPEVVTLQVQQEPRDLNEKIARTTAKY